MGDERGKSLFEKFWLELKDMLSGAAFPLIMVVVLGTTIFSWIDGDLEDTMKGTMIFLGEVFIVVSFVIFGKQNGVVARRKSLFQAKKRELGAADKPALLKIGEYAPYKGFIIGLIPSLPYVLFEIIECTFPNAFCRAVLSLGFGWAYFPFRVFGLSGWFGLLLVLPLTCVHGAAYIYGAYGNKATENGTKRGKSK